MGNIFFKKKCYYFSHSFMSEFWFTYTNMTFECMWVDDEESACHPIRKLFWSPAFISYPWFPADSILVLFAQRSSVHYRTSCMDHLPCTHLLLGDQMVSLLYLLHKLVFFLLLEYFILFPARVPKYFNLGRQPSVAFARFHLGPILRLMLLTHAWLPLLEVSCLQLISAHVSCSCCY